MEGQLGYNPGGGTVVPLVLGQGPELGHIVVAQGCG
jgi:hypothetical protein